MPRSQKTEKIPRSVAIALGLIVVAVFSCFLTTIIVFAGFFWGNHGSLTETGKAMEITGLRFPPGTQVLSGEYIQSPNKIYLIGKLRLPPSGVQEFIRQPRLQPAESGRGQLLDLASAEFAQRGWRLENAHHVLSGESRADTGSQDGGPWPVVYTVDLDNPRSPLLYLYVHD